MSESGRKIIVSLIIMFLLLTELALGASIVLEDYTVIPGRTGIEELTGINYNCKNII